MRDTEIAQEECNGRLGLVAKRAKIDGGNGKRQTHWTRIWEKDKRTG